MGAVFVYNLVNLVWEVEKDLDDAVRRRAGMQRFPIERVFYDPSTNDTVLLPLMRTCRGSTPRSTSRPTTGSSATTATRRGPCSASRTSWTCREVHRRTTAGPRLQRATGSAASSIRTEALCWPSRAAAAVAERPVRDRRPARGLSADITTDGPGPADLERRDGRPQVGRRQTAGTTAINDTMDELCKPHDCHGRQGGIRRPARHRRA